MMTAFARGFSTVWERIDQTITGPTQVDDTQQRCSGFKGQDPPRDSPSRGGSPEGGRTRWTGEQGDEMTLVAACRDVLRVVSAEEGSAYEKNLGPVIEEAGDLFQPLGEIWTDELPAYQGMEHDHRTVLHDEEYASAEGVHTNQAECLWSVLQPWLAKFHGLLQAKLGAGCSRLRVSPVAEPRQGTDPQPHRLRRRQCIPLNYRRAA